MPLQNRVDPFGVIHAVRERGLFTGNRGIIHDPETKCLLRRRWTTKAWIICVCEFQCRKRQVMGPGKQGKGSWTELFFLDEVTALAAGHRPCFYCRREAAEEFVRRFGFVAGIAEPRVRDVDARLHDGRLAAGAVPRRLGMPEVGRLPDGAVIAVDGMPHAIRRNRLLPWRFSGYGKSVAFRDVEKCRLTAVTPRATAAVLTAGYQPEWHPSAGA